MADGGMPGCKGSPPILVRAFSLLEVAIALGVVSFALVAVLGILPIGMGAASDVVQFTAASQIAGAIDCDLRNSSLTNTNSAFYRIPLGQGTNDFYFDSLGNTSTAATAKFRARVTINPPVGAVSGSYVSILLAWPAGAAITNSSHLEVASFLSP